MFNLDTTTEFGARVQRRLTEEPIVWLTTIRPDGRPEPVPVWFLWDGQTFLIYSRPETPKLANIAAHPRVSLNFNTNATGGDVVVFGGEARIAEGEPAAHEVPAYVEKYKDEIPTIGMTPETFAADYSVPIRVTPTKVRGF
jgi:PPOX class probable F420-dependent enzyme